MGPVPVVNAVRLRLRPRRILRYVGARRPDRPAVVVRVRPTLLVPPGAAIKHGPSRLAVRVAHIGQNMRRPYA